MTRSTRIRPSRCARRWRRSATSSRRCSAPTGPRASCSATAGSTGRAPRSPPAARTSSCCAAAGSRSSGTERACGRSCTSGTPRTPRSPPWSAGGAASTTSSTTTRRRSPSGWPARPLEGGGMRRGASPRVSSSRGRCSGREAAAARPALARPSARRRGRCGHDDRGARSIEREGEARARLAAGALELARGLRGGSGGLSEDDLLRELRPVAFAIAYRMLGSVSEAEDIVQEALLRLHGVLENGQQIKSPRAFVTTVTTRLAINELRSARARRERYVGEWLPEPIITDGGDDPAQHAEMADSLSLAMLVLLERLTPEQRAVLLLHDVFDYDHAQIAEMIGKSPDNVRQIATRARRHVEARRPRFQTTREQRDELARRFFGAAEQGDRAELEALLAADVRLTGDGGGKAPALARSLRGRSRVARALVAWMRRGAAAPGLSMRRVEVNGAPGALYLDGRQRLISVLALDIAAGQITGIDSIVNPDKLSHLGPVGDLRALLREAR